MGRDRRTAVRATLLHAYRTSGLWGQQQPPAPLPAGLERGSDPHLAFLTLVYTISGGRDPQQLWPAARQTFSHDQELFNPHYLAYVDPATLRERLRTYQLTQKPRSEATVWQRIGQALVMRGQGSVSHFLAKHDFEAATILARVQAHKSTFPVLAGEQTTPRWLWGLTAYGEQRLKGSAYLPLRPTAGIRLALAGLEVETTAVSAELFDPLNTLGQLGCQQRPPTAETCPAAPECPVADYCRYA